MKVGFTQLAFQQIFVKDTEFWFLLWYRWSPDLRLCYVQIATSAPVLELRCFTSSHTSSTAQSSRILCRRAWMTELIQELFEHHWLENFNRHSCCGIVFQEPWSLILVYICTLSSMPFASRQSCVVSFLTRLLRRITWIKLIYMALEVLSWKWKSSEEQSMCMFFAEESCPSKGLGVIQRILIEFAHWLSYSTNIYR